MQVCGNVTLCKNGMLEQSQTFPQVLAKNPIEHVEGEDSEDVKMDDDSYVFVGRHSTLSKPEHMSQGMAAASTQSKQDSPDFISKKDNQTEVSRRSN